MNIKPWYSRPRPAVPFAPPKDMTCCFTGHRFLSPDICKILTYRLDLEIAWLAGQGVSHFVAGGALGFDTLAAQAVLRMRKSIPNLQLHLYLPSPNQASAWNNNDVRIYNDIRNAANTVSVIGESNTAACMMQRNQAMVKASCCVIAYYDPATQIPGQPPHGGTYNTVKFAHSLGIPVTNLHDESPSELSMDSKW